jgi:hypothetical protein
MPLIPYSFKEGIKTLFGQTDMQREHAVHFLVKLANPVEPGGHTGYFLFSLTVDALVGFGTTVFCPEDELDKPKNSRTDPAINFRLSLSISISFFRIVTSPYERALSGQLFRQLKQSTHLEMSTS